MAKEELLELDGIVDEVLPDSRYRVTLDNGVVVGAYASGRMRKNHIRILAGDRVTLELSVYDLTKGRINFRHKDERATGGGQIINQPGTGGVNNPASTAYLWWATDVVLNPQGQPVCRAAARKSPRRAPAPAGR